MRASLDDVMTTERFAEIVEDVFAKWPTTKLWDGAAGLFDEFEPYSPQEVRNVIRSRFILGETAPKPGEVIALVRAGRAASYEETPRPTPDACQHSTLSVSDWLDLDATGLRVWTTCVLCFSGWYMEDDRITDEDRSRADARERETGRRESPFRIE